jgi:hypothetical protein
MSTTKTLYIWDGGVFSPPTRAVGKLAFNIATYMASKHIGNIEYHFVPTNKYYNKPWVRCIDEDDRIHMLDNLVTFINNNNKIPSNIKFIVNEYEIKMGRREKIAGTTLTTLTQFFKKNDLDNVYLSNSIENVIQRVKAEWKNSLELLFLCNTICYDIYSEELIGANQSDKYVYNSINLRDLLNQANYKFPEKIDKYFNAKKITKNKIKSFIADNKYENEFDGLKQLIMDRILFLPKHLVPETYKAFAGNRVREELDVYYSSLNNIQKLTTPGIEKYITSKKLYEHCKSRYKSKLVSKSKKNPSSTKKRTSKNTSRHNKTKNKANTKKNKR